MGCSVSSGADKPKKIKSIRQLKLEKVGVYSVDAFVDQFEDLIERFAKLTDDIERKRNHLTYVTGF
jgi:hypothetical protein